MGVYNSFFNDDYTMGVLLLGSWCRQSSVLSNHSTIQQEPPEIVALFKDYAETTSEEKIQRWKRIKQQQKDYLASWKLVDKSDKSKEQGDLKRTGEAKSGSSMDHRKRVPTPPPPPPRPDLNWPGTRAKAAPKRAPPQLKDQSTADSEDFWFDRLTDERRIGQAPLLRERARETLAVPANLLRRS